MVNYDFSTLNDRDLEELARDILSKKLGFNFQSFKPGPDKGIDLRYSTVNDENEIVVQIKHFIGSGISKLKTELKTNELQKVISLNPMRYIFVTSLQLSPKDKEEIKTIFNPFIISTDDILGKNDINSFLRNNPKIEEIHFKLWLSSTNILKRILKNGIKGRSEFFEEKIKKNISIFVPNKTHKNAVDILNRNNFILITGAPGIGKSTLANMLTYQLLAKDFELIYVREITEAEDLFLPEKKQVFYFDDFLGTITLDLKSSRNADSAIVNFIERVKSDKQKKLILTCRTTILNQAKEASEKIGDSKIDISNHEVNIEDYRDIDKAKILYNHIYFSQLVEEQKSTFFKDKFYWQVIKHKFYNPRVIEYFTDKDRIEPNAEYNEVVMNFLNNPSLIWEKPFVNQISSNARLLLSTLYSLGGRYVIFENRLRESFNARLDHEIQHNNYVKEGNTYENVIKELVGGFINRTHKNGDSTFEYSFFNPSIEDFLYDYFSRNKDEYITILKSAIYFEQFKERITTKHIKGAKRIYFSDKKRITQLFDILNNISSDLTGFGNNDLNFIVILLRLFQWNDIKGIVIERLNAFNLEYLSWGDRDNLIEILSHLADNNLTNFIAPLEELILSLSKNMDHYYHIEIFSNLISKHSAYKDIIENAKNSNFEYYNRIQENIDESWNKSIDHYIKQTYNLNSITNKEDLIEVITKRKEDAKKINLAISINNSTILDSYEFDYASQLDLNNAFTLEEGIEIDDFQGDKDVPNETLEINRLFNSNDIEEWNDLPF
ncbi:restriction endonuclease [Flavobacterium sp. ZB4R12]|uniref:nSTAND3 domain-containing NTPase n=1 Tax=Flavobacterium sp. ZB4R12 TaxID=3398732 RepID=UPI003AAE7402